MATGNGREQRGIRIAVGREFLEGDLSRPEGATGLVLFAHCSGSGRQSLRSDVVAARLQSHGLATLLINLLTSQEGERDARTAELRFDIALLANRMALLIDWAREQPSLTHLPLGLFGASTGAAAALVAAAARPDRIAAVVCRGGRPDLAAGALPNVLAPTLLIVGENDAPVVAMSRTAAARMRGPVALEIVSNATHLFEEPGTLERVAQLAAAFFTQHAAPPRRA